MFSYLTRKEFALCALFIVSLSTLAGAWVGFVSHSQYVSLARHINSSK